MQATPLLDRYLFNTFKKAFGGRVRFIVSGGAPLSTHVEEYLKVTLCTPVFQVTIRSLRALNNVRGISNSQMTLRYA